MARRGSYAKGVAKREEILERALDVVAREGYRGASVKEIAEAVGLSQAGLLHYFDSKEELFTEILRKRDEHDGDEFRTDAPGAARAAYLRVIRHNVQTPGLVELFSRLAVEAADPAHPAHAYFLERTTELRAQLAQQADEFSGIRDVPPETLARIVQAVTDGLQLQWLLDRTVDMAGTVEALFAILDDARATQDGKDD